MPVSPIVVETSERLNRNLGLLQPGASITLDMTTPAGKKGKFRTQFIGYLPKNYVLIQFPEASKVGSFVQYIIPGLLVTVRGLIEGHEGAVVAFVANVRQTLQNPSRLIVLEFPKKVTLQHLRATTRIDTNITLKVGVTNEYFKAQMSNISLSGCQILVNNAEALLMANDKAIEIVIENFKNNENLKLLGTIRNTKKQANDVSIGVHFSNDIKEQVMAVIEESMIVQ